MSVIVDIDGKKVEWDTQPTKEDIEEYRRLSAGQSSGGRVGIKGMKDVGQYMYQQGFEGLKDLAKLGLMTGPDAQEIAALKAQGFTDADIKEIYQGGMKVLEATKPPGVDQLVYPGRSNYGTRYLGAGARAVTGSLGIGGIPSMFGYGMASEMGGDVAQSLGAPRIVGEFAAPAASPLVTAPFVAKKALESAVKASPEITGKISQFQLGGTLDQIRKEVPELDFKLGIAERLAQQNPNFTPNLAQITDSTVAESIIKRQIARPEGAAFQGTISQAEKKTKKAVQQILARNFPVSQDAIANTATAEVRTSLAPALEKQVQLNDAVTNLGAALQSKKGSEQEIGTRLRTIYDNQLRAATDVKNGLYAKANEIADKRGLVVAPDQVRNIYKTISADLEDPMNFIQNLPTKEKALLSRVMPRTNDPDDLAGYLPLKASEVDGAIKSLNTRIFKLDGAATPEALTEASRLKTVRSSLIQALGTVDDADYQNVLSIANQYYKNGFKPRFREGMGYDLLRANQRGQAVANSEVVRKFLAKPENVDDFASIYGGREDAYELLKDGVYTMLIKDKGDSLSSNDIKTFVSKYDEGLSKFPKLKQELLSNQSLLDGLERKALEVEKSKDSALAGVLGDRYKQFVTLGDDGIVQLKSAEFQDSINRSFLSAANGDAVGRRDFNSIKAIAMKNPDAAESLRNYVVNAAASQPNPVEFLKNNDGLVGNLFKNKKDYQLALDVLSGVEMSRKTPARNVPVTSAAPELGERQFGIPASSVFSKLSNPILSGSTAAAQIFSKFLGKQIEEYKDVAYRAILTDPSGFKAALEKTGQITDPKQIGIEAIKSIDLSPLNTYLAKKGIKAGFVALQPNGEVVVDVNGRKFVMPIEEATRENIEDIRRQIQGQ